MSVRRRVLAVGGVVVGLALAAPAAFATTYVANRFDDPVVGGTTCAPPAPPNGCSLRGAITVSGAGDTIELLPGTYALDRPSALVIGENLTITGAGTTSSIIKQTGTNAGVIDFTGDSLTLNGLEITGGNLRGKSGDPGAPGMAGTAGANVAGAAIDYTTGAVTLTDVTVTANTAQGGTGGAGGASADGAGGPGGTGGDAGAAITGDGPLTALRVAIVGNTTTSGSGGAGANGTGSGPAPGGAGGPTGIADGGAISTGPTITITDSLIADNRALQGTGGAGGNGTNASGAPGGTGGGVANPGGGFGGAIFTFGGIIDLTNVTVTGNVAGGSTGGRGGNGGPHGNGGNGGNAIGGGGGGLNTDFGAKTRLDSVTLAGNTAGVGTPGAGGDPGSGVGGAPGMPGTAPIGPQVDDLVVSGSASTTLELRDTIIAGGASQSLTATDCYLGVGAQMSTVTSDGHNLDDDNSCIPTPAPSDHVSTPAGLGPLADNGGPTQTMALLAGSAAIATGASPCVKLDGVTPLTTDQRGFPRAAPCDIGAFEGQPPAVGAPVVSGAAVVGDVLSCTPAAPVGDPPLGAALVWLRDGVAIGGAAGTTYTVTAADNGHQLSCRDTVTNPFGSAAATSTAVLATAVPPPPNPQPELTKLAVKPSPARRGHRARVTFTLRDATKVTFSLHRRAGGITVGKSCVKPTRRHRHGHACARLIHVDGAPKAVSGHGGANSVGWTPPRSLSPGTYVLSATPAHGAAATVTVAVTR